MTRGLFELNTHDLPRRAGEMKKYDLTFSLHEKPLKEKMGTDLIEVRDEIRAHVRIESVDEGVLLTADINAIATGECVRCLDPVSIPIERDIQELYRYQPDSRKKKREAEVDDLEDDDELMMDGEIMDLEVPIRDAIILSLPINPLCSEECEGLCPECGAKWSDLEDGHHHESVDARWSGLAGLKEALEDGEK